MALLQHERSPPDSAMVYSEAGRRLDGAATLDMICPLPPPHLGDLLRAIQPYVSPSSVTEKTPSSSSVSKSETQSPQNSRLAGSTFMFHDQDFDAGSLPYQLSAIADQHGPEVSSKQQTHSTRQYHGSRSTMSNITDDAHDKSSFSDVTPRRSKSPSLKTRSAGEKNISAVSVHSLPQDTTKSHALSNEGRPPPASDPSAHVNIQQLSHQAPYSGALTSARLVDPISSAHTEHTRPFENADVVARPSFRGDLSDDMIVNHSSDAAKIVIKGHLHRQMEYSLKASEPSQSQISTQQIPFAESGPYLQHKRASPDPGTRPTAPISTPTADTGTLPGSHAVIGMDSAAPSRRRRKTLSDVFHRGERHSRISNDLQNNVGTSTNCTKAKLSRSLLTCFGKHELTSQLGLQDPSKDDSERQPPREHLGSGAGRDPVKAGKHHRLPRFLGLKVGAPISHHLGSRIHFLPVNLVVFSGSNHPDRT